MPKMYTRQPEFTYSAWSFTKKKKEYKNKKKARYSIYFYQNKIDKGCFQHDMAYRDFT